MKRFLIQTQLSNYNTQGKFILECDSGWQMTMGRVREMLKLNPDLNIDVMCPLASQWITHPYDINPDIWGGPHNSRLRLISHHIMPNALATRFDLDWQRISTHLNLADQKKGVEPHYDAVLLNDPMHLRNFQAMFHVAAGYQPKWIVHSHFIDNPECPKFPREASLWLGQCEAAIRADFNFWQCESAMNVFFASMGKTFNNDVVAEVVRKSEAWDDGYSIAEITVPPDHSKIRFDTNKFLHDVSEKIVVFVPNRIGGKGRSSDYTNCGKFMFELLPEIRKLNKDFVVIAGNPSQKFSNKELEDECDKYGYVNLVSDSLNRDEFKYLAARADITIGLYDQDAYGGTVARECIELGSLPFWLDNYEYSTIAVEAGGWPFLAKPDFSDFVTKFVYMLNTIDLISSGTGPKQLLQTIRRRCSYESTTPRAMKRMGLLEG